MNISFYALLFCLVSFASCNTQTAASRTNQISDTTLPENFSSFANTVSDTIPNESNDEGDELFVFTARGDKVDCSPNVKVHTEAEAVFIHNFHGVNYLSITGSNQGVPPLHEQRVIVHVILQGELAIGEGSFTGVPQTTDCLDKNQGGCNWIADGAVNPNGDINYDQHAMEKSLQSTSGTFSITHVSIGPFINGYAEGKISGTFSFMGTELGTYGKYPGTCSGKFENIPLSVQK